MAELTIRKGRTEDRTNAILVAFGEKSLDSANILVAEEGGKIVGAACGVAPRAGDMATLGQFTFADGDALTQANRETFRALLKAHVAEAIELGFAYGEAIVKGAAVKRMVERRFGVEAEVAGTTNGKPSRWRFVITLKDFLKVL